MIESAAEVGASEQAATRTYNALCRAGITQKLEERNVTLDRYSDMYLLNIRNFGHRCLELARDANERYKKMKNEESE